MITQTPEMKSYINYFVKDENRPRIKVLMDAVAAVHRAIKLHSDCRSHREFIYVIGFLELIIQRYYPEDKVNLGYPEHLSLANDLVGYAKVCGFYQVMRPFMLDWLGIEETLRMIPPAVDYYEIQARFDKRLNAEDLYRALAFIEARHFNVRITDET